MTRSRSDVLSLTLPIGSRSRARRRRRKRPPPLFWIQLAMMALSTALAIWQFLDGNVILGACNTWTAAFAWNAALAARDDRLISPFWFASQTVNIGVALASAL